MRTAAARRRSIVIVLAALAISHSGGCARWWPAPVPMRALTFAASKPPVRCLVVLLPGRGATPENFAYAGFENLALHSGVAADLVAADARLSYYYRYGDLGMVERLRQDVIAPARAHGYEQIWLVGTSLGATTALLYFSRYPEEISGMLLIAPFLGESRVVQEVAAAGGPAGWSPPAQLGVTDFQRRLWIVLKQLTTAREVSVPLYLGYGDNDRFMSSNEMLAAALPANQVFTIPGHHDWHTFARLWKRFLATDALPRRIGERTAVAAGS